jgi:hypothetical protein
MTSDGWSRPHYAPGGGNAFLSYFVFGRIQEPLTLSRERHRSDGLPNGLTASSYDRERDASSFASFFGDPVIMGALDETPELREIVKAQTRCTVLRGEIADPSSLDYLRDVIGLLTCLLDHGGVAILDLQALKWWSPAEWRAEVFAPAKAVPHQHVTILISSEPGGTQWFHTRGMRTFGRPDISVRCVPADRSNAVLSLCNRFIQLLAQCGAVEDGQEIRMPGLPDGMQCRLRGRLDDPDFNNLHIEVIWPGGAV